MHAYVYALSRQARLIAILKRLDIKSSCVACAVRLVRVCMGMAMMAVLVALVEFWWAFAMPMAHKPTEARVRMHICI